MKKKVAASESVLLEILWRVDRPLSINQIMEYLNEENINWAYTTTATILNRMKKKNLVKTTKNGRAYFYEPVIEKADIENKAVTLIDRYYQGSLCNFLAMFSREKGLTVKEINDLKEWVKKLEDDSE